LTGKRDLAFVVGFSNAVVIQDSGKPPAAMLGFRNECELPLRLGLVIDTSNSITHQLAFEQEFASGQDSQTDSTSASCRCCLNCRNTFWAAVGIPTDVEFGSSGAAE
jgi:hypothetical protein